MTQENEIVGKWSELWTTIFGMNGSEVEHNLLGKLVKPKSATPATVPVNKKVPVTNVPTKASINDARAIVAMHLSNRDKKKATAKSLRELSMRYATGGVR